MTEAELRTIHEIEVAAGSKENMDASKMKAWMSNPSIEVLGALAEHILPFSRRTDPPPSMEEICRTIQNYYRECLIQNVKGSDYAADRHVGGYEFVAWFRFLWSDTSTPRDCLVRIKTMLADLCVGNQVPQEKIVGAVLEHLFEMPAIAEFFADWRHDASLRGAYALAMEWV